MDPITTIVYAIDALARPLLMAGVIGYACYWVSRRHQAPRREALGELTEEIRLLRDQVESLQDELGEVHERLDFAERAMIQAPRPSEPESTPV